MTDNKRGPVKPPVLEMSARDSGTGTNKSTGAGNNDTKRAEASTAAKPSGAPTAPGPAATNGIGHVAIGVIGGGLLGLVAAYVLAWAGLWPGQQMDATPDPRLAAVIEAQPLLNERVAEVAGLADEVATLREALEAQQANIDERLATLGSENAGELEALSARIESLPAPGGGADDGESTAALAELAARIEAIEAAPVPDGQPGDSASTASLEASLAEMTQRLDAQQAATDDIASGLETIETRLEAPSDITSAVRMPLILAGLDTAFAAGRPYVSELDALRRTLPELDVAPDLVEAAGTGLPRDGAVRTALETSMAAILAARPGDETTDWQGAAANWVGSVLALRPAGEIEGDEPVAVLSRLEAAVVRGDFLVAGDLFEALPEAMRDASGEAGGMIALRTDAARLLEDVRRNALSLTAEANS